LNITPTINCYREWKSTWASLLDKPTYMKEAR
jgi:hypothetical protein